MSDNVREREAFAKWVVDNDEMGFDSVVWDGGWDPLGVVKEPEYTKNSLRSEWAAWLARAALAAPSAATGSGDEADRLDALRAQRAVVTRNYARDPSNENEAALYAICERVYAAERKVAAATGSGAATGPRDEAVVAHRPGHRPPVGFNAVVEVVSASDLEADDVIFAEGGWKCVIDDGINDSTQVMAAEIVDDAAGQGLSDTTYGEWFARVVALVPQRQQGGAR